MRSYITVAVVLAAASAAPVLARPVATTFADGSEAVNWKKVGHVAEDVGSIALKFLKREDPLFARAFEDELLARAAPTDGSEAINWKEVGSIAGDISSVALKFLKRDDLLLARALDDPVFARNFEEELLARDELADGSEAINWKKIGHIAGDVGSVALKFLKREDPLLARAFEDELVAREIYARAVAPADGSEAINWKKVGHVAEDVGSIALKFLKREDPLLARAFEDELLAREEMELMARAEPADGSEAINWKKVGHVAEDVGGIALKFLKREDPLLARAFEEELFARDAEDEGSEAINWKKVGHVAEDVGSIALKFLKREDPLLARAFEDELYARGFDDDDVFARAQPTDGSEAINWKNVGHVAGDIGSIALKFLKRDGMVLDELD